MAYKLKFIGAALILIAAILIFVNKFWPLSDAERVKARFGQVSRMVDKTGNENLVVSAAKLEGMKNLFTNPCSLSAGKTHFNGDYTPLEVYSLTLKARFQFSSLSLSFYDISVNFPEPDLADVAATVRFTAKLKNKPDPIDEIREINCQLTKTDEGWLFKSCETVEALEK